MCVEKRSELRPSGWILHHDNAPAHMTLCVKQFLAKKLITEIEHPPYSQFGSKWLLAVSKNKYCLKGTKISGYWRHQKECDSTESYGITGIPEMFPTVAA
jgi:hypothetical protein